MIGRLRGILIAKSPPWLVIEVGGGVGYQINQHLRTDVTLDYLKQRVQFNQVLASFQALQHRAAHLYSEVEIARAVTIKAAQLLDAGHHGAVEALVALEVADLEVLEALPHGVEAVEYGPALFGHAFRIGLPV